jgi:hypothetical protein
MPNIVVNPAARSLGDDRPARKRRQPPLAGLGTSVHLADELPKRRADQPAALARAMRRRRDAWRRIDIMVEPARAIEHVRAESWPIAVTAAAPALLPDVPTVQEQGVCPM